MTQGKPLATVSLDLDNLWCYQRSFGEVSWQQYQSYLNEVIPRILAFLRKLNLNITFFVVGRDAIEKCHTPVLRQIIIDGHEVANHSLEHKEGLHLQDTVKIRRDLMVSHEVIEQACGVKPIGYRGPAYGISQNLLQVIDELGYEYDSSSFYNRLEGIAKWYHGRRVKQPKQVNLSQYNRFDGAKQTLEPSKIACKNREIWELPVSTFPRLYTPIHGTYLHYLAQYSSTLALAYFRAALKAFETSRTPLNFLLHATDFIGHDDGVNLPYLPGMKLHHEQKIMLMDKVLKAIQERFITLRLREFSQAYQGPVNQVDLTHFDRQ